MKKSSCVKQKKLVFQRTTVHSKRKECNSNQNLKSEGAPEALTCWMGKSLEVNKKKDFYTKSQSLSKYRFWIKNNFNLNYSLYFGINRMILEMEFN